MVQRRTKDRLRKDRRVRIHTQTNGHGHGVGGASAHLISLVSAANGNCVSDRTVSQMVTDGLKSCYPPPHTGIRKRGGGAERLLSLAEAAINQPVVWR